MLAHDQIFAQRKYASSLVATKLYWKIWKLFFTLTHYSMASLIAISHKLHGQVYGGGKIDVIFRFKTVPFECSSRACSSKNTNCKCNFLGNTEGEAQNKDYASNQFC